MDRLAGRQAVVTGGARGIGAAMARAFVAEGAEVAILDLDGHGAAATAADIGPACRARAVDVRSEAEVDAAFDELEASGFAVDLLVNDAAIQREAALPIRPSTTSASSSIRTCSARSCARVEPFAGCVVGVPA